MGHWQDTFQEEAVNYHSCRGAIGHKPRGAGPRPNWECGGTKFIQLFKGSRPTMERDRGSNLPKKLWLLSGPGPITRQVAAPRTTSMALVFEWSKSLICSRRKWSLEPAGKCCLSVLPSVQSPRKPFTPERVKLTWPTGSINLFSKETWGQQGR